jgi:hypothetical protein
VKGGKDRRLGLFDDFRFDEVGQLTQVIAAADITGFERD